MRPAGPCAAALARCAAQQRRGVRLQLGRVQPVPMAQDLMALRRALWDREKRLERKHAQYEKDCPPFAHDVLMEGLVQIEPTLWGKRQKETAKVLQELMIAEQPRTVNDAIAHTRDTYRIGRRALRMMGDIDSEISWIVGHYLCGVIGRVELTCHGASACLRRYRRGLILLGLFTLAVYSHFHREIETTVTTIQETVKQLPEANPFREPPPPPPPQPTVRSTGSFVGCALPAAAATFVFGPAGAAGAAGGTALILLIGSIELRDE